MTKKLLILMRHGDSPSNSLSDTDRVLSNKGTEEVLLAASFLLSLKIEIDKLLVSSAIRTRQTAEILLQKIPVSNVEYSDVIYTGDMDALTQLVEITDPSVNNLLLVGHNPFIYQLACVLAKKDSPEHDVLIETGMPTARLIIVELDCSEWSAVLNTNTQILNIFTPNITKTINKQINP